MSGYLSEDNIELLLSLPTKSPAAAKAGLKKFILKNIDAINSLFQEKEEVYGSHDLSDEVLQYIYDRLPDIIKMYEKYA